jgi:hypothetical protein
MKWTFFNLKIADFEESEVCITQQTKYKLLTNM